MCGVVRSARRLPAGQEPLRLVVPFARTAGRRLISAASMVGAVGQSFSRGPATKVKIGVARIPDRPFADPIGECEDRRARHVFQFDVPLRRLDMPRRWRRCDHPRRSGLLHARPARRAGSRDACRAILDRRWAPGQTKTVCLTDNGIACYAPQMRGNLAGAETVMPQRPKLLDPFAAPLHDIVSLQWGPIDTVPDRMPARCSRQGRKTYHDVADISKTQG